MANERPRYAARRPPRFFLAEAPVGGVAELAPEDVHHAAVVLRLGVGERLIGMDGRGGSWLCRIRTLRQREIALEVLEDYAREPKPGSIESSWPKLRLHTALPRGKRADLLIERVLPLGLSSLAPLECAKSAGFSGDYPPARFERLAKAACKQAELSWLPELSPRRSPADSADESRAGLLLLSPGAGQLLAPAVRQLQHEAVRELALYVGPEAGFTEAEHASLRAHGAQEVGLGPSILRIEHAAEAALAIALHAWCEAAGANAKAKG